MVKKPGFLFLLVWILVARTFAQDDYGKKSVKSPVVSKHPSSKTAPPPTRQPRLVCPEKAVTEGPIQTGPYDIQFVGIPQGTFCMGSTNGEDNEKPVHLVTLSGFEIGRFEVTQAQWEAVMGTSPGFSKGPTRPVEQVSWDECQKFIQRLNTIDAMHEDRLPTEAEWEYACRAGTTGDYAGNLDEMGWHGEGPGSQSQQVGQKKPNAWGLYDMHGNVWEWCQDWYGPYPNKSVTNPQGAKNGAARVNRGGGWGNTVPLCRSAYRGADSTGLQSRYIGFRLVRTKR